MGELERLRLEVERAECLQDSAYKAGLKAGWNLAVSNDEAGYQAAMEPTEHISELKRIREAIRILAPCQLDPYTIEQCAEMVMANAIYWDDAEDIAAAIRELAKGPDQK